MNLSARGDPAQSTYSGTFKRAAFQTKCLYVRDMFEIAQSNLTYIFSSWLLLAICYWVLMSIYRIELYNIAGQTFVKFGTVFLRDLSASD